MPDITLRDIVDTFTEEELDLSVPIDFKDVDANSMSYVNQYNTYLANGEYETAYQYRVENADILEPLIVDAHKLNILMALAINSYLFARDEKRAKYSLYDNTKSGLDAKNVQDAIDEIVTEEIANINDEVDNKLAKFSSKIPTEPQDIQIAGCTVTGKTNTTTSLKDGVQTEINLSEISSEFDDNDFLYNEDGGIRIYELGWYLVSASAYIHSDQSTNRIARSIFVKKDIGNGKEPEEIISASEVVYYTSSDIQGAVATATKLIKISNTDMDQSKGNSAKISLCARSKGADGTVDNDNCSTFLTVVRVGHLT